MGVPSVGVITVVCYLIAEVIKLTPIKTKWIPVICLVMGAVLGILGMYFISGFPAEDHMTAVAVGIVSGGAATSFNQVYKKTVEGE